MSCHLIRSNILLVIITFSVILSCQKIQKDTYMDLIKKGEFSKATEIIKKMLENDKNLSEQQKIDLSFEIERMERIRKDFTKTEEEVFSYISKYIPNVTKKDIEKWEREKSLEYMIIDGHKYYFNRADRNLFRIDKACNKTWEEYHNQRNINTKDEKMDYYSHNREIMNEVQNSGKHLVKPVKLWIHYTITIKPDMVPSGETIRCWIPYPREIPGRQEQIHLIKTEPVHNYIADNKHLQRTIYLEKPATKSEETVFYVEYTFVNHGVYFNIDPEKVTDVDIRGDQASFLMEKPPHIVFVKDLKELSHTIIGNETNPYRKAQLLFKWVDENIPWASAREYSTIRNLSLYGFQNRHGDCGIRAMLFITLCRMNGIPARWQSGWDFKPPYNSMHDWGMIYFKPYGWMPMDVDYGLHDSNDENLRWFYLSGMDSYRLIFNEAFSQTFDPAKKHFRSETVDSQRGEVEWNGGNLYFDQWSWNMQWKVLEE